MKLSVNALSNPPGRNYPELPPRFKGQRLPGGEVCSAGGAFGYLCVQEFEGGSYLLRDYFIETREAISLQFTSQAEGLHSLILLQGNCPIAVNGRPPLCLHEGQFILTHPAVTGYVLDLKPRMIYSLFEVIPSAELMSALEKNLEIIPVFDNDIPGQIDEEIRDHIRYIFHYDEKPGWRETYFENRAWDIAWKLLTLYNGSDPSADPLSEEDLEKAALAKKIILDNLDVHIRIRQMARMAGLSESRLKKIFGQVHGMAMHEFRIYHRVQKANELLQSGKSIKEIAALLGWRPANLIRAYRKQYKVTPGTLKKKR